MRVPLVDVKIKKMKRVLSDYLGRGEYLCFSTFLLFRYLDSSLSISAFGTEITFRTKARNSSNVGGSRPPVELGSFMIFSFLFAVASHIVCNSRVLPVSCLYISRFPTIELAACVKRSLSVSPRSLNRNASSSR